MGWNVPNPVRLLILWIGLGLTRLGLIEPERARRTTDLAWPRVVTGLARMSKSAVDVAMVGIAAGSAAIAGVGFASPFWLLAFSAGNGVAGGTIALVSQRFGADAYDELGDAVRSSVVLVVALTVPLSTTLWLYSWELVGLVSNDPDAIAYGGAYLRVLAFGVPFAAANLVGSRVFVGIDDAWTPMMIRSGGAVANVVLNAVLIFGLGLGVVGAAMGTVVANVLVCAAFAATLVAGRFPTVGALPIGIDPFGSYRNPAMIRDLVEIGTPVLATNLAWTLAKFPMLAIVDMYGTDVVAAYVITRRIWGLMNVPGWGFGLASSSLVGQALGANDEGSAAAYGREIITFAVAVYLVSAALVAVFADPIARAFVDDPSAPSVPIAVSMVYAACLAMILKGVAGGAAGALKASGDTRWPFYSQALGMFGCAIPLAYLGATTSVGIVGLYLALIVETAVPAAINYRRFATGKWKAISRSYRPDAATSDD